MSGITETFEWCKTCGLVNIENKITNYGGECCTIKKRRIYGKQCDYWIRMSETQEMLYAQVNPVFKK